MEAATEADDPKGAERLKGCQSCPRSTPSFPLAGSFNIITSDHVKKTMNNATVRNIGHFDNGIDLAGSGSLKGKKVDNIKPQKIVWSASVGHGVIVLASGLQERRLLRTDGA